METDAAQIWIHAAIIAIIVLVIGKVLLFPAVCRVIPLQVPGIGFDYCFFFR
jgi:hypothetical protein